MSIMDFVRPWLTIAWLVICLWLYVARLAIGGLSYCWGQIVGPARPATVLAIAVLGYCWAGSALINWLLPL